MESNPVQGKIFVGGMSVETSEETLTQHFSRYGEVVNTQVIKFRETNIGKGFGFITFADSSVIDQVLQNQHVILGRTVDVKLAMPKGESRQCQRCSELQQIQRHDSESSKSNRRKIFVGGLPPQLLEEDFKKYFESFGRIEDTKIIFNRVTDKSRGFGFVTYVSEESVIHVLQERFHVLENKSVEVKRAEPRERRIMDTSNYYHNFSPMNACYEMWLNHTMVPDWTSPFIYLPQPVSIMIPYFVPRYPISCFGSMHNQVNDCNVSSIFVHNSCGIEWQNNDNNLGSRQEGNNQDCNNGDVENGSPPAAGSGKPLEEKTDNGEKKHLVKISYVAAGSGKPLEEKTDNGEKISHVATGSGKPLEEKTDNGEKEHLVKISHVNTEANNDEKDYLMKTSQVNMKANNSEKDRSMKISQVNTETNNDRKEHLVKNFQINTKDNS